MKPYPHQKETLNRHWARPYYALFWEMGLGKSKTLLDMAFNLHAVGKINGVAIVTNKAWYRTWPDEQIPAHFNGPCETLTFSSGMTMRQRQRLHEFIHNETEDLKFLIINIESIITKGGFSALHDFLKLRQCLLILDESSSIKNPRAKRTRQMLKLARMAPYRRIANGTPITQSPLDFYTQLEFLSPGLTGFPTFTAYRSFYADVVQVELKNGRVYPQIRSYRNLEHLSATVSQCGSRLTKDDCLDLPEKIFQYLRFDLTPAQRRDYDDLKERAVVQREQGLMTVNNALTMLMRLHQIACGRVHLDGGDVVAYPDNPRLATFLAAVEDCTEPVIVWCHWVADVQAVTQALRKAGKTAVTLHGPDSEEERKKNIAEFRGGEAQFLVTNETGSKAQTLTHCAMNVYYSTNYKLEYWLQSQDRTHRIGQHRPVTYLILTARRAVDIGIYQALREKKKISDNVLQDKSLQLW